MLPKFILYFLGSLTVGHILVWLQVNGQLIWPWFKNNALLLSLAGIPISYLFIKTTAWGYKGFAEQIWPCRLVGFAVGTMIFGLLTWIFMGEVPDTKAWVSIALAGCIIAIQILL